MASDINEALYDDIVSHMADVKQFEKSIMIGNGRIMGRHLIRMIQVVKADLENPSFDPRVAFNQLRREQSRFATELNSWQRTNMLEFSTAEMDFNAHLLHKQARGFYDVVRPKPREIMSDITGASMRGEKSLTGNIKNISAGELLRIQTRIKNGKKEGLSNREILKNVKGSANITKAQIKALTSTSMTSTQRDALTEVMAENPHLFKGFMFTAVLDDRTSSICRHHHGEICAIDDKRFMPPLHFNCRSIMVPVIKSKKELQSLVKEDKKIKEEGLDKVDPDKLNGRVPEKENYGDWLKRQSYATQVKMLGSDFRAKLFRSGKLKADQFSTPKGNPLSITALRRRAANAVNVFKPKQQMTSDADAKLKVARLSTLVNNPKYRNEMRDMFIQDASDRTKTFSLTDFRGVTLKGKQTTRRKTGDQFRGEDIDFNPATGEMSNRMLYDPNFKLYQERIDFMRNSKTLKDNHKDFIQGVADALEDKVSVNQQTVAVENMRVVFERALKDNTQWESLPAVMRAENRFAVQNTSRLLHTRQQKASEVFARWANTKEKPQVQIMGKYYDLDDINKDMLKDQRYIDKFRRTTGKDIASELFVKGKAPARVYFQSAAGKYPTTDKVKKWMKEETFIGKAYVRAKKLGEGKEPTDSWWTRQKQKLSAKYRNIADLEFIQADKKPTTKVLNEAAINSLSKSVKLVASGQMTDYDGIAIAIGKNMAKDFENIFPLMKHTTKDYHKEGSKILDYMIKQKLIRTNYRGKVRRGVLDVDTGRASGSWGDTVSREVQVLDKRMIKLQEAEQRNIIARRLGVVSDRDRLYVRANHKTYFDARGKDTNIPIISRDKFASYDPKQIDRDMAKAMNHAMNTQYEVDGEFFGFMDDVVRFRDPRGNSAYYDGINEFRHEILKRGDQGYGFMTTAKWHAERGKPFRTEVYIDSRGRVYHRGYMTPTGGEMVRPFLGDSKAQAMDSQALKELRIQTGAMIGPGTEALTQDGRLDIFSRNEKNILELGNLMLNPTQRDRRIREFLEHPLIKELDGTEVPKMARMAMEYARIHNHTKGDMNNLKLLKTYKTKLMIENDASSSGAQIIGLSTGDRAVSEASNVLATTQKNRLYDLVAIDTVNDPQFNKIPALRDANLTWEDLAKAAKSQNMVSFYGSSLLP